MEDSFSRDLRKERERSYELFANEFAMSDGVTEPHGRLSRLNKTQVNWMVSECCGALASLKTQQIVINDEITWGDPYPDITHHWDRGYFSGQCSKCKGYVNFSATYKTNIRKNNTGD